MICTKKKIYIKKSTYLIFLIIFFECTMFYLHPKLNLYIKICLYNINLNYKIISNPNKNLILPHIYVSIGLNFLAFIFHKTQHPQSLFFAGPNILCLYTFIGLNVLTFMFSQDSTSSPLCFHRTQRPRLYVSIGLNVLAFIFRRTQHPLSLCFHSTQRLCLYFSQDSASSVFMFSQDSMSSVFIFHRTQCPLSLCFSKT